MTDQEHPADDGVAGHVALVTGAASGIGRAIAHDLATRGARVVGVDVAPAVADVVAELPGTGHHAIVRDLTDPAAADAVVDEAIEVAGGLHIAVNSAGIVRLAPAIDLAASDWDATLAVNLSAAFFLARAAGRRMLERGYGRIVSLASQAAVVGLDEHVAYCASKAGLLGMTRVLSLEWAGRGVTVNTVSPTVVDTPLGRDAWAGEKGDAMRARIPAGRFATPEEVAGLVAYLAGPGAAMITGENILIDGGYASV